jgi:hypothetical protein
MIPDPRRPIYALPSWELDRSLRRRRRLDTARSFLVQTLALLALLAIMVAAFYGWGHLIGAFS